jgi:hypothetical protein
MHVTKQDDYDPKHLPRAFIAHRLIGMYWAGRSYTYHACPLTNYFTDLVSLYSIYENGKSSIYEWHIFHKLASDTEFYIVLVVSLRIAAP